MPYPEDLPDYFAENYGECLHPNFCVCLKQGVWLGTVCEFWKPCGAKDYNELRAKMVDNMVRT